MIYTIRPANIAKFTIFLLLAQFSCKGLEKEINTISPLEKTLESYQGIWKGKLSIFRENMLKTTIDMSLQIIKLDDKFEWTLRYGENDIRKYILKKDIAHKNHYIIDEQNSIQIDATWDGSKLSSFFEVEKNLIQCNYVFSKKAINFEIYSANKDSQNSTGNSIIKTDTIPEVKSWYFPIYQKAVLKK
jgi:hypothetical protein